MTGWELNPIVLCHCQRFFGAVAAVIDGWEDEEASELSLLIALLGNAMWARSSFVAQDRDTEEAMAMSGALASTLAGRLPRSGAHKQQALDLVAAQERQVLDHYDQILDRLRAELDDSTARSPGELNRWVWTRLFPRYPHGTSTVELQQAIRARLKVAMGQ